MELHAVHLAQEYRFFQKYVFWLDLNSLEHESTKKDQFFKKNSFIDSYSKWIRQKSYQFFKLKNMFFFICILTNYVPHEITKEFWKNSHFENMTAGFLLRCQNSLWQEISLICHWIIDFCMQMLFFGYVMVPKNDPRII